MSKVAVIGNTARAIGAVCASDLALSGHEVRYTVFPEQKGQLPEVRKAGGFTVEGDAKHLVSKKTGFARLDRVGNAPLSVAATSDPLTIWYELPGLL